MKWNFGKTAQILALGLLCSATAATTALAADKPEADLTVGFYSQYIWRGFEFSEDSMVIQPSMTIGYKGFGFNLWGNLDTDQAADVTGANTNNWNETDMTLSYDNAIGDKFSYGVGYIYYGIDGATSQEVYATASVGTILNPTLTVYREIANLPGWYITAGISHGIPLGKELSLDLGAQVGFLSADDRSVIAEVKDPRKRYGNFHDGVLSAAVSIPLTEKVSLTPELYYSFPLTDEASDLIGDTGLAGESANENDAYFVYGGVSVSFAF